MSDTKYNGWENYQTWNVSLWIDNDEGLSSMVNEEAAQQIQANEGREDACAPFADWLEEVITEQVTEGIPSSSMASDLIGHALGMVDWREIADYYLSDCDEYENAEE